MMKKRTLGLFAGLCVVAGIVGSNAPRAQAAEGDDSIHNILFPGTSTQSPVLVYDITGGTLAGIIHFQLSVYDSGYAAISASGFSVFDPPDDGRCPNDGRADYAFLGTEVAKQLSTDLKAAGAFTATNGGMGFDVPLQTVTVLQGRGADAKAHSFTFQFASNDKILATVQVLNAFIDEHFPGY